MFGEGYKPNKTFSFNRTYLGGYVFLPYVIVENYLCDIRPLPSSRYAITQVDNRFYGTINL